jgi:hypothetical protein
MDYGSRRAEPDRSKIDCSERDFVRTQSERVYAGETTPARAYRYLRERNFSPETARKAVMSAGESGLDALIQETPTKKPF